jgi:anti-sigma regulatory factor (Ser/Thr protein kinase)
MADQSLIVPARLDQIEQVCSLVARAARSAGFDRKTTYDCELAVAEACENIIKHGYAGSAADGISVVTHAKPGELTIELEDSAPPFNPASRPHPSNWTEEDPPVGGFGLLIIHRVMDEVEYHRQAGRNRLRMLKRCQPLAS